MNKNILINEQDFLIKTSKVINTSETPSNELLGAFTKMVKYYNDKLETSGMDSTENDLKVLCHCFNIITIGIESGVFDADEIDDLRQDLFYAINGVLGKPKQLGVRLFDKLCSPILLQAISGNLSSGE